jgi:hypothetical protein
MSSICDDSGQELLYVGMPIIDVITEETLLLDVEKCV